MSTLAQNQNPRFKPSLLLFILMIILAIMASSCKCKHAVNKYEQKVDTIRVSEVLIKQPDIFYDLTFDELCDTVSGEVRAINQVIVKGGDTLKLWTEKNQLSLQIDLFERILSKQRDSIQKSNTTRIESETIIRHKFHWWYWPLIFILLGCNLYFSGFYKILFRLFGLKFL